MRNYGLTGRPHAARPRRAGAGPARANCVRCDGHAFALGNQLRVFAAEAPQDFSFVADEHHTFFLQLLILHHELVGHGRLHAAVVPEDVDGSAFALGTNRMRIVQAAGNE